MMQMLWNFSSLSAFAVAAFNWVQVPKTLRLQILKHFFILHSTEAEPDSVEASNPLFPEFEYSTTAAGTRIPYLLLIARRGENELVCDKKEGVVNDHRTLTNGPRDYWQMDNWTMWPILIHKTSLGKQDKVIPNGTTVTHTFPKNNS